MLLLLLVLLGSLGSHVHSDRTNNSTTGSSQEAVARLVAHLVACKPTQSTSSQCGAEAPLAVRVNGLALGVTMLVMLGGCTVVVCVCAALLVWLLRWVRRVAAVLVRWLVV